MLHHHSFYLVFGRGPQFLCQGGMACDAGPPAVVESAEEPSLLARVIFTFGVGIWKRCREQVAHGHGSVLDPIVTMIFLEIPWSRI